MAATRTPLDRLRPLLRMLVTLMFLVGLALYIRLIAKTITVQPYTIRSMT